MAHNEVEDSLQTLMSRKGVLGYVIMDATGAVVHTGFEPEVGEKYAILIHPLAKLADNMTRDLDPRDGLQFLRVRTGKREIMVSTYPDFTLAVVQSTHQEVKPESQGRPKPLTR